MDVYQREARVRRLLTKFSRYFLERDTFSKETAEDEDDEESAIYTSGRSRISDITVFRVCPESKSPLTKSHCVGYIYYSRSPLSSNRIPARQRQPDSILIGRDGRGGGGRESQFPERSRCNLRLKQRGGTTITDCIYDRRRG